MHVFEISSLDPTHVVRPVHFLLVAQAQHGFDSEGLHTR
jgi:hypothetical protein